MEGGARYVGTTYLCQCLWTWGTVGMCWKVWCWVGLLQRLKGSRYTWKFPWEIVAKKNKSYHQVQNKDHIWGFVHFWLVLTMSWPGSSFKSMDFGRPRRGVYGCSEKPLAKCFCRAASWGWLQFHTKKRLPTTAFFGLKPEKDQKTSSKKRTFKTHLWPISFWWIPLVPWYPNDIFLNMNCTTPIHGFHLCKVRCIQERSMWWVAVLMVARWTPSRCGGVKCGIFWRLLRWTSSGWLEVNVGGWWLTWWWNDGIMEWWWNDGIMEWWWWWWWWWWWNDDDGMMTRESIQVWVDFLCWMNG